MNKKKVAIGSMLILIFFAVYIDQGFEYKNINNVRVVANSMTDLLDKLPENSFTTDGCSLWLNSFFGNDFTDICVAHDMEYWKGGSKEDRKNSDRLFRESINEKVFIMGDIMYFAVRVFGHPVVPAPWRWGYGFEYPYKY